jgi:hypothetical protein
MQMEALARVTCGICLHHAAAGTTAGPSLLPPSAASQLPQAQHLLAAIQGAAAEAEAAMAHYNKPSASAGSMTSSSGEKPKLGAALFCCQAVVLLQKLAADLAAGISCCKALDEGVAAALAQVGVLHCSNLLAFCGLCKTITDTDSYMLHLLLHNNLVILRRSLCRADCKVALPLL